MQNEMEPGHPRRTGAKQGCENQNPGAAARLITARGLWLPRRAAWRQGSTRGLHTLT